MFPGTPVIISRSRIAHGGPLQVFLCASAASRLQLSMDPTFVLPSSTGVLGWRLPTKELSSDIFPKAIDTLQTEMALPVAQAVTQAIMTTIFCPKIQSFTLLGGIHIAGIAKGAGVIKCNMTTMLSYIFTNATITQGYLLFIYANVYQK